jgi:hypothetical protein
MIGLLVNCAPWLESLPIDLIFREMMCNPRVIHFSSDRKPWHFGNRHPLRCISSIVLGKHRGVILGVGSKSDLRAYGEE